MTSLDTASAVYEDELNSGAQSAGELAVALERQAREIEQGREMTGLSAEVRTKLQDSLSNASEQQEVAEHLHEAAEDIRSSIGAEVTIDELPDGVAGQAQLGTDAVWIDPHSIRDESGERLINADIAADVAAHEEEHTKQSATADQEGITIGEQEFDARQIREAAAISVQNETAFLSSEYQKIFSDLPMNESDRQLVREGRFADLERSKNGIPVTQAA